jgi:hypothetical protein
VSWKSGDRPRRLTSQAEILQAQTRGEVLPGAGITASDTDRDGDR